MDNLITDPFIRVQDASAPYFGGVHRTTLATWAKEGKIPKLLVISKRIRGWRKSTLDKLLAEREGATQ